MNDDEMSELGQRIALTFADIEVIKKVLEMKQLIDSGIYGLKKIYESTKAEHIKKILNDIKKEITDLEL